MKIIHKTSMLKALKRKLLLSKKEPKAQTEHKHSPAGPGAAATSSFSSTDESSSGLFNSVQSFSSFDSYSDSDFETADFEEQPQLEKPTTIPELDYASVILHNHNDLIRSIVPAIMDHVSDYFRPTPEFKTKIDILFKYSFNEVFFLEHLAQHPEGDKETPEEKAAREKKTARKKIAHGCQYQTQPFSLAYIY